MPAKSWLHVDCFHCQICDNPGDTDSTLLFYPDGSFGRTDSGGYRCSVCEISIDDKAILTGDEAYCEPCFRFQKCLKTMSDLTYVRTSYGIYCLECHESYIKQRRRTRLLRSWSLPRPVGKDILWLPADGNRLIFQHTRLSSEETLSDHTFPDIGHSANDPYGSIGIAL